MFGISPLDAVRGRYAARLGVALFGAVVLLLVLGLLVQAQTASQVREDARADLESSAAIQADEVTEWVEGNRRQVRTVSKLPVLRSDDSVAMNRELGALVERGHVSDEVVAIHVVSKTEKEVIASSRPEKFVGVSPVQMNAPFVPKMKAGFSGPDEVYVSKPFRIPIVKFPIVAILSPVPGEKRVVVFMINPTGEINELRQPVESGRTHVLTANGRAVAAPNNTTVSGPAVDRAIEKALDGDVGVVTRADGSLMGYSSLGSQDWVVLTHVERADAYAMITTVRTGVGGMILVALLGLAVVGATIGRSTSTALRSLAADARELGRGDLSTTFDVDRSDEIGTLAATLAETRDSLRARINEVEQMNRHLEATAEEYRDVMRAAAAGDLTNRLAYDGENEAMADIAVECNRMLNEIETATVEIQRFADEVVAASEDVTTSSKEVQQASHQVTESIQQIADGAEQQNEQLQAVASEMDDLSATIEENAATSSEVAELAQRMAKVGQEGREAARDAIDGMRVIESEADATVDAIDGLEDEIAQIDDLLELISDVARRTNMLALNANVEASRIGGGGSAGADGGVGFAAVADQIKELATGTNEAAKNIERRLDRIKSETAATADEVETTSRRITEHTDAVATAAEAFEDVATYAQDTNDGIQEISAATQQQAATTQEVVAMTDTVAAISEETAAQSETVTAAAEEQTATLNTVSGQATELSQRATELQSLMSNFDVEKSGTDDADEPDGSAGSGESAVEARSPDSPTPGDG